MKPIVAATVVTTLLSVSVAGAQWATSLPDSFPRTPDGEPDLFAPAPKTADGKPDLSGVWLPDVDPGMDILTVEHMPFPKHFINVAADLAPEQLSLRPAAAELFQQRRESRGRDNPTAYCKPTGVPRINTAPLPYKIVQTDDLVLILYEENTDFRQIFLDGRRLVDSPIPRWMGYSTGRWEGDALVVETVGFKDEQWLDGMGHPHSDALRLTARFRRIDSGHMEVEITIDDPGAYTKPFTYTPTLTLMPEDDLLEYFCTENEKSAEHYR